MAKKTRKKKTPVTKRARRSGKPKKAAASTRTKRAPTPARKKKRAAPKPTAAAPSGISPKQLLLDRLAREHETTRRVMGAFPADRGDFQPHPRSFPAKRLMWTFVQEQRVGLGALTGTLQMPPDLGTEPETIEQVISAYETSVGRLIDLLTATPEAHLTRTVPFFTGPRTLGSVPVGDVLWLMLNDSIHHRGQLSVYVRMAGGLVPSIYGPSADEPWM